jgi:hypothetical protein
LASPQWVELRSVLVAALEPYPKALAAVQRALADAGAGANGAAMLALAEHAGGDGGG